VIFELRTRVGASVGISARSPDRESTLQTKVRTLEHELHNRNCTMVHTKCSNPYNVGWEGVFIPPNLITSFQKCPSGPHEGQEITSGVFGNSLGWTVRLGYSYSDHMFLALRGPSVVVFDRLRLASLSLFAILEPYSAPEGSCHSLREHGPERSLEPSGCPKHPKG